LAGAFIWLHLHALPLDVVVANAARRPSEAILEALGGLDMQDCRYELRRIPLPRTPVNKGRGMKFGRSLCPFAVNLWFLERTATIAHSRLYGKCLRNSSLAPSDAKPS